MKYDVFICHASEDKDAFVRPLAVALKKHRVEVWFDEFSLRPGDSLRRSIDKGLMTSRFGIVVLSPSFFAKAWPQWELDGLVEREISASDPVILPVWHGVQHADVLKYSPPLAGKVGVSSAAGHEEVARQLLTVVRPDGSTLLIARDLAIEHGAQPPPVTDDWWLDVVEASVHNTSESTVFSASGWGRWGFPLPRRSHTPAERGRRLGWAALQVRWKDAAWAAKLSQISPPGAVLRFIEEQPGLRATCERYPEYLAAYAPQLVIPGLGGPFEERFESEYAERCQELGSARQTQGGRRGEEWRLLGIYGIRDPGFSSLSAETFAKLFIEGPVLQFGPTARVFGDAEYVAWILSASSAWLPAAYHRFLFEGLKAIDWTWGETGDGTTVEWSYWQDPTRPDEDAVDTGGLRRELIDAAGAHAFGYTPTQRARADLIERLGFSRRLLELPESSEELASRVEREGFLRNWIRKQSGKMAGGG